MALFGKKICPRCGAEVHSLRDITRKFAEGVVCGDCTKLLYPYWEDTKKCTLADFEAHLAHRSENLERLRTAFSPDVAVGVSPTLYVDTARKLWCFSFDEGGNFADNPELFTYEQLKKFDFFTEKSTSYFRFHIIDHPYAEDIVMTSNRVPVKTMKDMCDPLFAIEAYNKERKKLAKKGGAD